jgi:hypothetical protein
VRRRNSVFVGMRAAAILFVLSHQTLRNALDYFRMVPAALLSALKHAMTPATGQEIPKANQLIFGRRKHSGGRARCRLLSERYLR